MNALKETNFTLPGQTKFYRGKVRDVYTIDNNLLVMIASDRISAFDVVLPEGIPGKGQVLNQVANKFLDMTSDIVPNWKISTPDPMVTIGHMADPFKVEMVIRGFLTGHAWRTYKSGERVLCGVTLPEGMKEHDAFPEPIITPSTKADQGDHDEDISREEILKQGIVSEEDYVQLEKYTRALFARGQEYANERGLILVDTKYEFGKTEDGTIVLIDEIHTPDSSRYFYLDGYEENQKNDVQQKQLSKEFVRQWLIENGFQGKEGQQVPEMTEEYITSVSDRYVELYEQITGEPFKRHDSSDLEKRIEENVVKELEKLRK
ncbi:phosphoribosylaminoimidazolesuccinocarboxamide (SAICAR) synthase [Owenweeksia hongkongensis DSM 17368]|uniref:Phosphoribosylaminoimidazole-succinocarboxamide synthase n=1 Tax=Owenweeksia hongkongensis (strain DSM 17368 / CIP 108786 / JCM 12287 / NRRL B-23963 / UST20020801) TaxID=926562 RepID=G8QZF2_OWEHD|nr:phosphoribosylaminoimidazolesuccinocarboxamide synthase [Owenweeksia hongkongensis]AEV32580.1 phosphoribosylaminoimidazolesuccinocarboxamide (SAICAR) synthase [Owenweeksia hongkongensis DSM 17368]